MKNIATVDDGNNRGVFAIRVPCEMTLKNNLFLFEDGGDRPKFSAATQGRSLCREDAAVAQRYRNNPWYRG